MASFLNRLRRRRTTSAEQPPTAPTPTTTPTPSSEPSTPASQPAVAIEEPSQNEPPPYTASTTATQTTTTATQQPDTDTARGVVSHEITQGLLDPNLNFTAAQMEYQWRQKDIIFARAVVQFIAERFDGNLKGWAGYKYTYICEEENPPRKESAWDDLLGYNAWSYRNRFRQVNILVKRDFERRGFEVRKCEVYAGVDGIYVEWSLEIRRSRGSK